MADSIDGSRNPFDKMASGLGQPDTFGATLEKENAKVFFKKLNAAADGRLSATAGV